MKNKFVSIILMSALALQVVACGASETKAESLEFETVSEKQEADMQETGTQGAEEAVEAVEAVSDSVSPENEVAVENEDPGQSYDFEGQYYAGRGNLSIISKGNGNFLIEVWWGSSAAEHSEWVMTGTYDEGTNVISYSDCEKHDFTLKENGEVDTDVTAYTNGTGNIQIVDGSTIVWTDDQDHIADDVQMTR